MQDNLARTLSVPPPPPPTERGSRKNASRLRKPKQKFRFGLAFLFLFLFSMSMLLVTRYAAIAELEKELYTHQANLERLQSENITKRVQIKQAIDMSEVEKIAVERLGMITPGNNQLVNIQVPIENTVHIYQPKAANTNFFSQTRQFFGNIVSYLH